MEVSALYSPPSSVLEKSNHDTVASEKTAEKGEFDHNFKQNLRRGFA
jgi:hypothetical protein